MGPPTKFHSWCVSPGLGLGLDILFKFRSLDILSVKKEARLSARALAEVKVGRGEEELWCNSLFIVCHRCRGLSEDEETRLE